MYPFHHPKVFCNKDVSKPTSDVTVGKDYDTGQNGT